MHACVEVVLRGRGAGRPTSYKTEDGGIQEKDGCVYLPDLSPGPAPWTHA